MTPHEQFIHDLSTILVKKGFLTEKNSTDIQQAFHESPSDTFDGFLLDEGFIDREDLLVALSIYYNVPSFEALGYFFDEILVRDFPKDVLLRHAVIPLKIESGILFLVAANPQESNLAVVLGKYTNAEMVFFVGLREAICDAVKEFYDVSLMEEELDEDLREEFEQERDMHRIVDSEDENEG